ncbi:hypothetical protein AC249_AIPGENE7291 [Exaiptasia diaphana]|nr:hypothetical protein AC249_AIPGENE7291 [Exaiptasia diaphana]
MDGNEELFSLSTLVSGVCSVTSTHDTGNPSNQPFEQQNNSSMDGSRDIKKERKSCDMIENSSANIKQSLTSNSSAVDQPCGYRLGQQQMVNSEGLIDINNIKQEPEDDYKTDNYPTTTSNSCVDNDSAQDMRSSYTDLGDSSCVICLQCNKWFDGLP